MPAAFGAALDTAFFAVVFLAVVFFAAVLRVVVFLAALRAFFLAGPRARFSASSSSPRSRVIDSGSSSLRSVALVSPSVTYGAEPAVLDHDRLPRRRVVAQLAQRRRGGGPAALLGLRVDRQRLVERHVEELLLGLERARVGALLQVRAVAAVLRGDLLAGLRVERRPRAAATAAAARRRASTVASSIDLNSDAVRGFGPHRLAPALGRRLVGLRQDLGDVRAVAAGLGDDRRARRRGPCRAPGRRRPRLQQLAGLRRGQLVGREVLGDRGPARVAERVVTERGGSVPPGRRVDAAGTTSSTYGP